MTGRPAQISSLTDSTIIHIEFFCNCLNLVEACIKLCAVKFFSKIFASLHPLVCNFLVCTFHGIQYTKFSVISLNTSALEIAKRLLSCLPIIAIKLIFKKTKEKMKDI